MSEIDLEPFDETELASAGTTALDQHRLKAKATAQGKEPKPIRIHQLPAVNKRPDGEPRSRLAELRKWIVDTLCTDNESLPRQDAVIYADLWLEYTEAQESIDSCGMVCLHPRTPIIIENPYMPHRAKTRAALGQVRNIRADWLWDDANIAIARQWLDAATAEREAKLTAAERHRLKQMDGAD